MASVSNYLNFPETRRKFFKFTDQLLAGNLQREFWQQHHYQPATGYQVETKKLFDALSDGGTISMELEDTFWGDYFGSCSDKFGVQWMFNCTEKHDRYLASFIK